MRAVNQRDCGAGSELNLKRKCPMLSPVIPGSEIWEQGNQQKVHRRRAPRGDLVEPREPERLARVRKTKGWGAVQKGDTRERGLRGALRHRRGVQGKSFAVE